MLERNIRQVRAKVIQNVKHETLPKEIITQIERKSRIYTDNVTGYDRLKVRDFVHETITHIEEYEVWLSGTYVAVEPHHLDRYVAEQSISI